MKTHALFFPLLIAVLAALIWSCATTGNKPGSVVADERGIVIPATPFTEADQMEMNRILGKYDKALYKMETRVPGQPGKSRGTLVDVYTDKALAASIAENLNKQGFTRSAVRIGRWAASETGAAANPQMTGPSATPVGSGANPHVTGPSATPVGSGKNPQLVVQRQLISELMPILEKYNK